MTGSVLVAGHGLAVVRLGPAGASKAPIIIESTEGDAVYGYLSDRLTAEQLHWLAEVGVPALAALDQPNPATEGGAP